jgi:hypothetical protein
LFSKREGSAFKDVSLWGSVYAWVLFRHLIRVGQNTFTYKEMMAYFKVRPNELGIAVSKGAAYGIIDRVPGSGYVVDLDRAKLYLPLLPKDIIKQKEHRLKAAPEWQEAYEYYSAWAVLSEWSNTADPDVPQHILGVLNKYGIEVKELATPDGLRPLTAVMHTVHGTLYLILMELPKSPSLIRCVSLPPDYGTDTWLCSSKKFYLYAYAPSLMP